MNLVISLNLEQTKENYQQVVDLLAKYDIVSVGWEEPALKTGRSGNDLGNNLSQAIDSIRESQA